MTNPIYALCIGVSNYDDFDPSGRFNLPGAKRDPHRWKQLCMRHFGLEAEQIRVHSEAEGARSTDRASLEAGLRWLGSQIGKQEGSSGLLTYSGHGLTMQQADEGDLEEGMSLALAPSDITKNLKASLNFQHIEQILFEAIATERFGTATELTDEQEDAVCKVMENITAVLDTCYDQPTDAKGSIRALTAAVAPPKLPEPPPKIFARLVLACQLWETSYEIKVANQWIGAFTFSITTMIEQWLTGTDDQTAVTYSRASYGDLVFRARTLLNTLGLEDQNPALVGTANNLSLIPFLRPGTGIAPGRTSVAPDGGRRKEEFSAGNDSFWNWLQFQIQLATQPASTQQVFLNGVLIGTQAQITSSWSYGLPAQSLVAGTNYYTFETPTQLDIPCPNGAFTPSSLKWGLNVNVLPQDTYIYPNSSTLNSQAQAMLAMLGSASSIGKDCSDTVWSSVSLQPSSSGAYDSSTNTLNSPLLTPKLTAANPGWAIQFVFNVSSLQGTAGTEYLTILSLNKATVYGMGVGNSASGGSGQPLVLPFNSKGALIPAPALDLTGNAWWKADLPSI